MRTFATSSLHASKGEIVAVRLGPLVPIGPLDSRGPRRIVGAGERATHGAVGEPRALHAARWLYFASRFEKEGDAIARDGRLQNAGADACVSRKKKKKKANQDLGGYARCASFHIRREAFFFVYTNMRRSQCVCLGELKANTQTRAWSDGRLGWVH